MVPDIEERQGTDRAGATQGDQNDTWSLLAQLRGSLTSNGLTITGMPAKPRGEDRDVQVSTCEIHKRRHVSVTTTRIDRNDD